MSCDGDEVLQHIKSIWYYALWIFSAVLFIQFRMQHIVELPVKSVK